MAASHPNPSHICQGLLEPINDATSRGLMNGTNLRFFEWEKWYVGTNEMKTYMLLFCLFLSFTKIKVRV